MKQDKFHGRISGKKQECSAPGCREAGEFRAPGARSAGFDGPGDYRWFCLDHVREFNAGYDWFDGMSAEEIIRAQHPIAGWDRQSRAFRPDAILAFWVDPEGTAAVRLGKLLRIPVGVIAGGTDVMILPQRPARARIIAGTLQQADHVFAVGSEIARRSIAMGAAPECVSNFFCGVDLTLFAPGDRTSARTRLGLPADGPLLLWVGQMTGVKAVDRLIDAAAQLIPAHPTLRVALVGDGELRQEYEAHVAGHPALAGRVHFPGPVAHPHLPDWYRAADLLVLPSRSEGVPNVLLEAMATGLPFVASDVGSIRDLLPHGPSRVTAEGDVPALTAAIAAVLGDQTPRPLEPVRYDRLDGARHLLTHLGLTI